MQAIYQTKGFFSIHYILTRSRQHQTADADKFYISSLCDLARILILQRARIGNYDFMHYQSLEALISSFGSIRSD
jgi:hypothetical protein